MCVLDELYEWYEAEQGVRPKRGEGQKQFDALWGRAERALGEAFSEELRAGIFAYMSEENREDFRAGFRLGARLMLEVCCQAPPR